MNQVYAIVLLALVGLVLTAQTAHGEDVIRLQNGTMVPNTLGVGAPNSEGITLLPNGTYGAYVNGAVGSQIGPVLVRDWHNGTLTANANMTAGARDNESDSDSTGNMTDPSSNSTKSINATEDVTGNPHRSQSWNAGYKQAFTGQALNLRTNHTLDFFYGYENGSEFCILTRLMQRPSLAYHRIHHTLETRQGYSSISFIEEIFLAHGTDITSQ